MRREAVDRARAVVAMAHHRCGTAPDSHRTSLTTRRPRLRREREDRNIPLPHPTDEPLEHAIAAVRSTRKVTILMADDDEDDRQLAHDAFLEAEADGQIRSGADGQELIDYLRAHAHQIGGESPGIVLLDLNMPRKDGRETLAEIKRDANLRELPVVVLTTSRDQDDVSRCYGAGASSFISKPTSHAGLVDVMRQLQQYWFELVELPGE